MFQELEKCHKSLETIETSMIKYDQTKDNALLAQILAQIRNLSVETKELSQNPKSNMPEHRPDFVSFHKRFTEALNKMQVFAIAAKEARADRRESGTHSPVLGKVQGVSPPNATPTNLDAPNNMVPTSTETKTPVQVPAPSKKKKFKFTGYLKKQIENGPLKTWKKRWFTLKENRLLYFGDMQDEKPKGAIDLTELVLVKIVEGERFVIQTQHRAFNLQAESEKEAQIWVHGLLKWFDNYNKPKFLEAPIDDGKPKLSRLASIEDQEKDYTQTLLAKQKEEKDAIAELKKERDSRRKDYKQWQLEKQRERAERARERERLLREQQQLLERTLQEPQPNQTATTDLPVAQQQSASIQTKTEQTKKAKPIKKANSKKKKPGSPKRKKKTNKKS